MEASAVRRLICVTGLGAGDSRGQGGLLYNAGLCLFLGRVYADKDVQERIIRWSRLDWTIVRPTILTNGPRTGTYRVLVDQRDWTSGFISRADVADFLVTQIEHSPRKRTFLGAIPMSAWDNSGREILLKHSSNSMC